MKKNFLIAILAILALALAGYVFFLSCQEKNQAREEAKQPATTQTPAPSVTILDTSNIHVFSPKSGDTIGLPLKISGEVRVFENQFNIRIKDGSGKTIIEESVMGGNGDAGQYNPFEKEIDYPDPGTSTGTIEVFDYSAKDGSEIDKVTVPIKFASVETTTLKVFFGNTVKNPQALDCQLVFPVERRVAKTTEVARAAINELLTGLSKNESDNGYITSINSGVKLQSITISNGIAKVDFDETLGASVGGSCRIATIRAQITQTLEQFPTIQSVVISIDGRTEDILQP